MSLGNFFQMLSFFGFIIFFMLGNSVVHSFLIGAVVFILLWGVGELLIRTKEIL